MATTVSNVQEALKYTYGANKVLYMFNEESVIWQLLQKTKKGVGGRGQFIMPLMIQNPGTFKGVVEGGSIPTAVAPDTSEATFFLQEYVGIYDITWKLLQDARSDKFAFQRAIEMMDDGLRRRVFRLLNADLLDNGKGRLGVLPGADDTSPISLNALPLAEKGMVVDVMDLSDDDTKLADSVTVTGVDPIARTVALSGNPSGTAAGDYLVLEDTTDASLNGGRAMHSHGLLDVIDDANPAAVVGNYGNINRSTLGNEFWKSVVLANSGTNRPLTEDLLLQAMDGAREKGSGQLDIWISNLNLGRRYHELLRADTFYALSSEPGSIGGGLGRKGSLTPGKDGKSPYQFSGVPWHFEPYFQPNTIVGMDTSHFYLGVGDQDVPRPISELYDVPFFKQTSLTTFEVIWYYQMQLLSDNPAAGVKILDVAEA